MMELSTVCRHLANSAVLQTSVYLLWPRRCNAGMTMPGWLVSRGLGRASFERQAKVVP